LLDYGEQNLDKKCVLLFGRDESKKGILHGIMSDLLVQKQNIEVNREIALKLQIVKKALQIVGNSM